MLDSPQPWCTPSDDVRDSPLESNKFASSAYNQHTSGAISGVWAAASLIRRLRFQELKAFEKSNTNITSPSIQHSLANALIV